MKLVFAKTKNPNLHIHISICDQMLTLPRNMDDVYPGDCIALKGSDNMFLFVYFKPEWQTMLWNSIVSSGWNSNKLAKYGSPTILAHNHPVYEVNFFHWWNDQFFTIFKQFQNWFLSIIYKNICYKGCIDFIKRYQKLYFLEDIQVKNKIKVHI